MQASNSPRAASIAQLRQAVDRVQRSLPSSSSVAEVHVDDEGEVERSVSRALRLCAGGAEQEELLLICGSFFLFRDARKGLGLHFPTDPFDLNESSLKPPPPHSSDPSPLPSFHPAASLSSSLHPWTPLTTTISSSLFAVVPSAAPRRAGRGRPAWPHRHFSSFRSSSPSLPSHRRRVVRLYRELLHLASHLRTPLTATPFQDVQRAFRGQAGLSREEDAAAVEAAVTEAESKAAFMRAQIPGRFHWKKGSAEDDGALPADEGAETDSRRSPTPLSPSSPSSASGAAWLEGYSRIFGSNSAERSGDEAGLDTGGGDGGVRRFVFDAFGEVVVPVSEEQRAAQTAQRGLHQARSNHQGITDEQRRRNQQLMDRFHFRGPRWQGKR